jgi:hypothetical protein
MAILVFVVLAFAVAVSVGRGAVAAVDDEHPADIPVLGDAVDGPAVLPTVVTAGVALLVLGILVLRVPNPVPARVRVPGRRRAPPSSR